MLRDYKGEEVTDKCFELVLSDEVLIDLLQLVGDVLRGVDHGHIWDSRTRVDLLIRRDETPFETWEDLEEVVRDLLEVVRVKDEQR